MISIRQIIRQIERFIIFRILHANDTPHRLALGIALGFFVAWTPTIGFQMVLVLLLAPFLRANGRVGVPIVWISNPLTIVPIYWPNYWIGSKIFNLIGQSEGFSIEGLKQVVEDIYNLPSFIGVDFWPRLGHLIMQIVNLSLELWIGSIIIGLALGILSYFISYKVIVWYRVHSPHPRAEILKRFRKRSKIYDDCGS